MQPKRHSSAVGVLLCAALALGSPLPDHEVGVDINMAATSQSGELDRRTDRWCKIDGSKTSGLNFANCRKAPGIYSDMSRKIYLDGPNFGGRCIKIGAGTNGLNV